MAAARNKPSTDLPDRVAAFFAPRLPQGRRVCVGLSGGRDSVALLHALAAVRQNTFPSVILSALHIHHGLSTQADDWADFCVALCRSLDIPLRVERVSVSGISDEGVEAAARRARYGSFATCDADWLALAHHRDDQAETLLLNLLRGAGVQGLAAMPEERILGGTTIRLVRPFLTVARREIETWLAAHGHAWIEDDSNSDSRLRRNFLRNDVMPMLGHVFFEPSVALARAAAHLGENAALAEEMAISDARGLVEGCVVLLDGFNALALVRRTNLLRYLLRRQGLRMPDTRYLTEIIRQLAEAAPDTAPSFPLDGANLHVFRGRLYLSVASDTSTPDAVLWEGQDRLPWAGGVLRFQSTESGGLDPAALAKAPVWVRVRRGGERFQPDPKRPRRSLKNLLRESAVPAWERNLLPLIWCGDDLVWVAAIGCDARYAAPPGVGGVLPIWQID